MPITGPALAPPAPLNDLLTAGLRADPDRDAVVSLDRRWSFGALDAAADRLRAAYAALGLAPGDRVASLMPNRGLLLVHYLACLRGGLVCVPLNYRYTSSEIDHALAVSGAALLLHHAERRADIAACEAAADLRCGVVLYGAGDTAPGVTIEALLDSTPPTAPRWHDDPAAPAFILFTSGSTGPAKGVTHSHGSAAAIVASAAAGLDLTDRDVMLAGSSISHLGGLLFSFAALSVGGRALVARWFLPDEIVPLLRQERPTVLCMLPAMLFRLVREGHCNAEDFRSLRLVRSGSDKVPAELEAEFTALTGLVIDEGYGCTEIGLATLNPPQGPIVAGSVGRPLPGFALEIRDADGRAVPAGQQGNLWARTPTLMAGYWTDAAATRAVVRDGWFDTGDVMRADADGYLWFCGRKKQIIVHDGSNIFPQEVEDALLRHPGVAEAGVIGIADLLHGETVRAYVVMRPGASRDAPGLIAFARDLVGYKAPEEIEFLDEMPLNPTGKTDRMRLKQMAAERHSSAG